MENSALKKTYNPALEYNKNHFGRPLKFRTPQDLQFAVDSYFDSCFKPIQNDEGELQTDKNGNVIYEQFKPFTITGLALALDVSRSTLLDYQNKDNEDFSNIIARAKQKCEEYAERSLFDRNKARGAEFVLNTSYARWVPRKEFETNMVDNKPQNIIDANNIPTELLLELAQAIKKVEAYRNKDIEPAQIIEETPGTGVSGGDMSEDNKLDNNKV